MVSVGHHRYWRSLRVVPSPDYGKSAMSPLSPDRTETVPHPVRPSGGPPVLPRHPTLWEFRSRRARRSGIGTRDSTGPDRFPTFVGTRVVEGPLEGPLLGGSLPSTGAGGRPTTAPDTHGLGNRTDRTGDWRVEPLGTTTPSHCVDEDRGSSHQVRGARNGRRDRSTSDDSPGIRQGVQVPDVGVRPQCGPRDFCGLPADVRDSL